ncbi:unnamed protein product [Schistosoma guineensis]|nr:unnamed protein product [Schistosoma guineensis]
MITYTVQKWYIVHLNIFFHQLSKSLQNTQYDLVSSVGRMAATNGDIVGANAYILTEEETLVPAAPPADEVTVTATTVEESSNIQDSDISETFSNGGDASNEDEKITTLTKVKSGHGGSNKRIWKTELSENTNVNLHGENSEAQTTPYSLSQSTQADNTNSIPNIKNKPNLSGDILLPLDEDCPRDVMIVETPDGETLYVHHQSNEDGSSGLVILNDTGEQVNNPTLMAQVMDALVALPENVINETLNADNSNVNIESELDASSLQRLEKSPNNRNLRSEFNKTIVNNDRFFQTSTNGCQTGGRRLSPTHTIDNEDDDEDLDNDESESLVAHLAAFANQPESQQTTICVEGMGSGASTHDLIMWCLYNGIFIRGYADEPTFIIEFVYQGEAYTLSASYDSQSGTINFYHVETNQKL